MRLGMKTRREIFEAHYRRYQRVGKKEKGKILDEMAGTTGLNRDHFAHVLASQGKKQGVKKERQGNRGEARSARRKRSRARAGEGRQSIARRLRPCCRTSGRIMGSPAASCWPP
jgi:hypothetical protein